MAGPARWYATAHPFDFFAVGLLLLPLLLPLLLLHLLQLLPTLPYLHPRAC